MFWNFLQCIVTMVCGIRCCERVDPYPQGSALIWLRIRIHIENVDPDPGTKKFTKMNNKPDFQPLKKGFCVPLWECFMMEKSDLDQDPHWFGGSV